MQRQREQRLISLPGAGTTLRRAGKSLSGAILPVLSSFRMGSGCKTVVCRDEGEDAAENVAIGPVISPAAIPGPHDPESGTIKWKGVFRQSLSFLLIEEGFRAVTEEGARHTHMPFFAGYANSVTNLHGWADGDPFLVNYVGHPMQGYISGMLWLQNDHGFRYTEFGNNGEYWKGRLRAAAFAFVYSEFSEIGPLSEATVGATQAFYPQQGFVDHVVTPTIGLAWILAEDAVDKYASQDLRAPRLQPIPQVIGARRPESQPQPC